MNKTYNSHSMEEDYSPKSTDEAHDPRLTDEVLTFPQPFDQQSPLHTVSTDPQLLGRQFQSNTTSTRHQPFEQKHSALTAPMHHQDPEGPRSPSAFEFADGLLIYDPKQPKGSRNALHEDVKKHIHRFMRTEDYISRGTSHARLRTAFSQFLTSLGLMDDESKDSTAAEMFRKKIKLYIDNISLEMKTIGTFRLCGKAVDWDPYTHRWLEEAWDGNIKPPRGWTRRLSFEELELNVVRAVEQELYNGAELEKLERKFAIAKEKWLATHSDSVADPGNSLPITPGAGIPQNDVMTAGFYGPEAGHEGSCPPTPGGDLLRSDAITAASHEEASVDLSNRITHSLEEGTDIEAHSDGNKIGGHLDVPLQACVDLKAGSTASKAKKGRKRAAQDLLLKPNPSQSGRDLRRKT